MLYCLDSRRWGETGFSCDQTDPFGSNVVENPVHVHYFNAILLHLLGIDHEQLTFTYQGQYFRLIGEMVRWLNQS